MSDTGALSVAPDTDSQRRTSGSWSQRGRFAAWQTDVRQSALANVADFVAARRATQLDGTGLDAASQILMEFVSGGKCLRSTFMYLGWLCGEGPCNSALRAASSMELLHAFALLQDDVMDGSSARRGRPAAHVQFADWHRCRQLSGSSRRFGESAAVLLGDLCLVWAGQMLRESGIEQRRLDLVWPRYDSMRSELAVGQLVDLVSDVRDLPPLEAVLDVAQRKSGNYTVRRPLEIGAAMAGCDERTLSALGRFGGLVGEAFQLRDDVLGVFGSPENTGKPKSGDLIERKATSVVVMAYRIADAPMRRQLKELMNSEELDEIALDSWRVLIVISGAVDRIETMISENLAAARKSLACLVVNSPVRTALDEMARLCTERAT